MLVLHRPISTTVSASPVQGCGCLPTFNVESNLSRNMYMLFLLRAQDEHMYLLYPESGNWPARSVVSILTVSGSVGQQTKLSPVPARLTGNCTGRHCYFGHNWEKQGQAQKKVVWGSKEILNTVIRGSVLQERNVLCPKFSSHILPTKRTQNKMVESSTEPHDWPYIFQLSALSIHMYNVIHVQLTLRNWVTMHRAMYSGTIEHTQV